MKIIWVIVPLLLTRLATAQSWEPWLTAGDSMLAAGQYAQAKIRLQEALALAETAGLADAEEAATILVSLGASQIRLAEYDDAELSLKRALAIRERRIGPQSVEAAKCLNSLGVLYKNTSRYPEAVASYRRALAIRESVLGSSHPDVAATLNNLANLLFSEAQYAEAEQYYQRALGIQEQTRGPDHPELATTLNNLAALCHVQGRYRDEEPLYRRALAIYQAAYGMEHPHVAQCLNNLGEMYHDQGDSGQAETLYRQALDIGRCAYGEIHIKIAETLNNLARLFVEQGRYEAAEPLVRRAIEIGEQVKGAEIVRVEEFRKNLGDLLQAQARPAEAAEAYRQALASVQKHAGPDHPIAAAILHSMSRLSMAQEDFAAAREHSQQAYLIQRRNFSNGFGALAERNALEFSRFLQAEAANYLSVLLDAPGGSAAHHEEIARVVFSTKGLVTDGLLVRHKSVSMIAALVDSLNQARLELSRLYVEGNDPARPWAAAAMLAQATERKEYFEAALARSGTDFRDEKLITQVDAQRIATSLPPRSVLVEYMVYRHHTGLHDQEPRYLAVVVRRDGRVSAWPLGAAAEVDSAVSRYRQHMSRVRSLNTDTYDLLSNELYNLIWQPLAEQVERANAVFISPDGALSLVSFAGLRGYGQEFLIERYPVHYVSSGRDLVREDPAAPQGSGLLAFGDPDYDATVDQRLGRGSSPVPASVSKFISRFRDVGNDCVELRDLQVGRLPSSRLEIERVIEQWRGVQGEPVLRFLDEAASEDAFKRHAPGRRVVHLATHGYYISSQCGGRTGYVSGSPLLLSGLFFAGSNRKGAGAAEVDLEDGVVTAEEVAGLNLQGTALVVLSACETGLGDVTSGEGVFGLRRAFQMAGAQTVISALWPVDDLSTAELMGALFASQEPSLYASMRAATLTTLHGRRQAGKSDHPFYWAGFIATGGWATRR